MPDLITPQALAELEEVEKAATPGPWYQTSLPWYRDASGVVAGSPDGNVAPLIVDTACVFERTEYDGPFPVGDPEADAAFIAALRNAFPPLADTIRALMAERDEAKEDLNTAEGRAEDALRLYDGAREDIDSLRADLANVTAERNEAKASEIRAWDQYAQKVAELAEAQARIAELEEGLRSFAKEGEKIDADEETKGVPSMQTAFWDGICTFGDFRHAARLLSPLPKEGPTP